MEMVFSEAPAEGLLRFIAFQIFYLGIHTTKSITPSVVVGVGYWDTHSDVFHTHTRTMTASHPK
jgi:hypothetical protein